jgi:hypothetical protein
MKILTTHRFEARFSSLSVKQMDYFYEYLFHYKDKPIQDFVNNPDVQLLENKENIYVIKMGSELRVFFTIINEEGEQVITLIDILRHP